MKKNREQQPVRLFKSNFLEALTKTSPLITLVTYPVFITILLLLGNRLTGLTTGSIVIAYTIGIAAWTLLEYVLHRGLFHLVSETPWLRRIPYLLHGVHHESPRDDSRLFMPPVPGAIIIFILWIIFYLLLGEFSFAFVAGLVNGYLFYSAMHYSMHVYPAPKLLRKLWAHHALHHYKYPDKAFGVSSRLWDRVFGTMPPGKDSGSAVVKAAGK
jgi:sterol desaturase/sphingolipid hydroxylase (fatty acid hydroxylase superfamily)